MSRNNNRRFYTTNETPAADTSAVSGTPPPGLEVGGDEEEITPPAPFEGAVLSGGDEDERAEEELAEAEYAIQATVIDRFCVKRVRVKVTPAVCRQCGFDVAKRNKVDWDTATTPIRDLLRSAIAEHVRQVHSSSELQIVKASELPHEWLGRSNS